MIEHRRAVADRAVLVGAYPDNTVLDAELMLAELEGLVRAAGGEAVISTVQRCGRLGASRRGGRPIDPATYIGRGKAEHVAALVAAHRGTVVVFDNQLSPAQVRELEKIVGCRVIDRSELILDIFAARARTREAKLQVELAQLQYTAPRLRGMWAHLERQVGAGGMPGLGMRGPGEKQIEIDRRLVASRLARLRTELSSIVGRRQREVQGRTSRHFCVGLVGYTNAGKSTLMNAVTGAGTYSADQLFATLDTKTRRWDVGGGASVMLSDTVGFVRDLPHQLVASFRATLEEALSADLLVHVIDGSHPQMNEQARTVDAVLAELGCDEARVLPVLNKSDLTDGETQMTLRARWPQAIAISARDGTGLEELRLAVRARWVASRTTVELDAPVADGRLQAFVRAHGTVEAEEFEGERWRARVVMPVRQASQLSEICPQAVISTVS